MVIYSNVGPINQQYRVFPLQHSWDQPFVASYEYKTDMLRSANGKEQRRAVRWYPRRTWQYNLTYRSDNEKQEVDKFFDQIPNRLVWMPIENDVTYTTATMGEEAEDVHVRNADKSWMVAGVTVLLQFNGRVETRVISGSAGGVMSFTEKNFTVWPPRTKITRALLCRVDIAPESSRLASRAGTMKLTATLAPGNGMYVPDNDGRQFLGFREYWHWLQNWGDTPSVIHEFPRVDLDYGFGRISTFVSEKFPQRTYRANFWKQTADKSKELIDFFCRHRGMNREFLVNSQEKEIPYVATAGLSKSIFVEGLHFGETYKDSTVYRRVMFKLKDGTEIHRQVDFIELLPETNTTVIWVTEELPDVQLAPSETYGLYWVTVARFATDRLDVSWLTSEVASFQFPFRNLENPDV